MLADGVQMDIAALKEQLPPLNMVEEENTPDLYKEYLSFYGIDFGQQLPGVRHTIGSIDSCGYTIACQLFQQDQSKGTFFLLHGYYDHVGLYRNVLSFLLQEGYNVLAYDLPGHGLSSGKPATIPDFSLYTLILEDLLALAETQLPKPWHAYGQSTGCAILSDCLISRAERDETPPFEQVVYSAPLVRPWMWTLSRIQLHLARFFIKQLPRKFTDNSRNQTFLDFAHNDPLAPDVLPTQWVLALDRWIKRIESTPFKSPACPLIIQGTYDRTVDARHNIKVLQRLFLDTEVLYLPDARHHLPNELEETLTVYFEWVRQKLS